MSGFDNAKVDAAFFPDGKVKSNFLINLGYGDRAGASAGVRGLHSRKRAVSHRVGWLASGSPPYDGINSDRTRGTPMEKPVVAQKAPFAVTLIPVSITGVRADGRRRSHVRRISPGHGVDAGHVHAG